MVGARDLKSLDCMVVGVRFPSGLPNIKGKDYVTMDQKKLNLDKAVKQPAEAEELIKKLQKLFPSADGKTQKMIKAGMAGLSLEHETNDEIRIFCVFYNRKTGNNCSFAEAINSMIKHAKGVGVKIAKKDINV